MYKLFFCELNSNFKSKPLKVIKTLERGSEIKAEVVNGFCSLWIKLKTGDIPTVKPFSQGIIFENIPEEYCPPCTISTVFAGIDKKGMLDGCYASITKEGKIWMLTRYSEVSAEINSSSAVVYFYYPVKLGGS